jgi:hypothetical protein
LLVSRVQVSPVARGMAREQSQRRNLMVLQES